MLSAPFHAIQTAFPANAQVKDFGEGRRGISISGNGAAEPTGFTQRVALTQGETRSLRSSVLVQSDLVAQPNGFEGIDFDVKALVRNGFSKTPVQTWTNAPFRAGTVDVSTVAQFPEWTQLTRVVRIPYDAPAEFIDCTWGVRGTSGEVRFISCSLRNYYREEYPTAVERAVWTSFNLRDITTSAGNTFQAHTRTLSAHTLRIPENSNIQVFFDGYFDRATIIGVNSIPIPSLFGIALKMRKKDGTYDWWVHGISNSEENGLGINTPTPISVSPSFRALSAYTQIEPVVFLRNTQNQGLLAMGISHLGLEFNVVVDDTIRSGGA